MNKTTYDFASQNEITLLKRILTILGTLLFLLTSILDYILAPDQILISLVIRYLISTPFFIISLYLSFKKNDSNNYSVIIALLAPVASLSAMASMYMIGGNLVDIYPIGILFTIPWLYIICLGTNIRIPVVYNSIIILSFILGNAVHLHLPPQYIFSYLFFMIGFSLLGYLTTDLLNKTIHELNIKEKDIKDARNRIQELYYQKTNTFINLAHETKTPLTLINNYFHRYQSQQKPSQELDIIGVNLDRLERDIVHFLQLEKELKHNYDYFIAPKIDLSQFVQDEIILIEEKYKYKNLILKKQIEELIYVNMYRKDCEHILYALLENAYKYSDFGSTVFIKLINNKHGKIHLSVLSFGEVIPMDQQENIFLPYKKSDNLKKNTQGLGMSLPIVKKVLDRNSGCIKVKSTETEGTEFMIYLNKFKSEEIDYNEIDGESTPTYFPDVTTCNSNKTLVHDSNKKSLLIIEDDNLLLKYMVEELSPLYNIYSATDGLEALTMLEIGIPSLGLILSDVMMDKLDGLNFLKKLKQESKLMNISVIFLSADDSEETRMKGLTLGAIDYISKPFCIDELKQKIQTWLDLLEKGEKGYEEKVKCANIQEKYYLSSREVQVCYLLLRGESREGIGKKLFISINTVKSHITSIYAKCGITNKTELLLLG